jgi:hypothetical protein
VGLSGRGARRALPAASRSPAGLAAHAATRSSRARPLAGSPSATTSTSRSLQRLKSPRATEPTTTAATSRTRPARRRSSSVAQLLARSMRASRSASRRARIGIMVSRSPCTPAPTRRRPRRAPLARRRAHRLRRPRGSALPGARPGGHRGSGRGCSGGSVARLHHRRQLGRRRGVSARHR